MVLLQQAGAEKVGFLTDPADTRDAAGLVAATTDDDCHAGLFVQPDGVRCRSRRAAGAARVAPDQPAGAGSAARAAGDRGHGHRQRRAAAARGGRAAAAPGGTAAASRAEQQRRRAGTAAPGRAGTAARREANERQQAERERAEQAKLERSARPRRSAWRSRSAGRGEAQGRRAAQARSSVESPSRSARRGGAPAARGELQAQFQRDLELEEQRLAAVASGKQAQYLALIRSRWNATGCGRPARRPASSASCTSTRFPAATSSTCGSANAMAIRASCARSMRRSEIVAVAAAAGPELFDRNLRFTFKPEE